MNTKDNPKLIRAWISYDWANSVHSLVIASAIFPVYYTLMTYDANDQPIKFLGLLFSHSLTGASTNLILTLYLFCRHCRRSRRAHSGC